MLLPENSGLRLAAILSFALGATAAVAAPGCYSAADGTAPPPKALYYPVGLAVSQSGNALYVANSDFDLQWNGGTLQVYDLASIRADVLTSMTNPDALGAKLVRGPTGTGANCAVEPPLYKPDQSGQRQPLGETCAPPVHSEPYVRDSAIIGAFATDLQLSNDKKRIYVPVRGNASLTWADVSNELAIDCGVRVDGRCDAAHLAGVNATEKGNTRNLTMPGEPFAMAQSLPNGLPGEPDAIVVTHQADTKASLFAARVDTGDQRTDAPALQFVLDGLPAGGIGLAAVPHDPDAFADCEGTGLSASPPPAFLMTSRAVAEVSLLRYYSDKGSNPLYRPFLTKEGAFPLLVNSSGVDSRGIAIDDTPRRACKAAASTCEERRRCARLPARVFIANRSPGSILLGEVGENSLGGQGSYDPDLLSVFGNVPLTQGPSRVYLAPVVDAEGRYALRVFVVCFDSRMIFVYDPEARAVENIIRVGAGPFAMAFDPFDWDAVARHAEAPKAVGGLRPYSFAYVASFTNSFVQVIDLDSSRQDRTTFERVVFTLGLPTAPKGS